MTTNQIPKRILPSIVVAQFCCTSVWFAGNAIMPDLVQKFNLQASFIGNLTSAVQLGFILGTFVFALFTISDRFSPAKVFFCCALIAASFNAAVIVVDNANLLLFFRLLTGFFLAGIYPVGMKIAADYYQKGLGKSLGFLVGALVLGTALPHLLKSITFSFPWIYVILMSSALAVGGGIIMLAFVPDGPFRKAGTGLDFSAFRSGFGNKKFTAAALGYFGHQWELYTFWAFIPMMLQAYHRNHQLNFNVSLYSFLIIAIGGIACTISGTLSQYFSAKKVATAALLISCLCCLFSPIFFLGNSFTILIIFLLCWGMAVAADSPLFSTLVAQNVAEQTRGTSLTIVNCIGFSITIVSIQVMNIVVKHIQLEYMFTILALGPAIGIFYLIRKP